MSDDFVKMSVKCSYAAICRFSFIEKKKKFLAKWNPGAEILLTFKTKKENEKIDLINDK